MVASLPGSPVGGLSGLGTQAAGDVRVQGRAQPVEVLVRTGGDVVAALEPGISQGAPVQPEVLGLLGGAEQQVRGAESLGGGIDQGRRDRHLGRCQTDGLTGAGQRIPQVRDIVLGLDEDPPSRLRAGATGAQGLQEHHPGGKGGSGGQPERNPPDRRLGRSRDDPGADLQGPTELFAPCRVGRPYLQLDPLPPPGEVHQAAGRTQHVPPERRQPDRPGRPVEEPGAEVSLQGGDAPAGHRLGDSRCGGAGGEAAVATDGHEGPAGSHHIHPPILRRRIVLTGCHVRYRKAAGRGRPARRRDAR